MITLEQDVICNLNQKIHLFPISDIHYGSPDCETERVKALVQWSLKKIDEGDIVLVFGTGDYLELPSPSERAALASAKGGFGLHDTTREMYDEIVLQKIRPFIDLLKPLTKKGAIIGLGEGHHYHDQFVTPGLVGLRSTQYICQELNVPYFGMMFVLRLNFQICVPGGEPDMHIESIPFTIMATHGYGSARTAGAQVNKRLRMAEVIEGADLYVMGHDNNKMVYPKSPLVLAPESPDGVRYHKQYFIGAGSFQRGYRMGTPFGGYVEDLALAPHLLGVNIAELKVEERDGKLRLDYHVSS